MLTCATGNVSEIATGVGAVRVPDSAVLDVTAPARYTGCSMFSRVPLLCLGGVNSGAPARPNSQAREKR